ncbi:MAG: putative bacteriochlorophyll 4-vinyl reductase [Microbacteriaceae bacterium]|nr:putative bacteriochlorophyll 4-vinyl reductase [Microbacteriaceae bacterium]
MFRALSGRQVAVDLVVAIVFALLGWISVERSASWGDAALLVLFAIALALRRLSPALALGVAWAAAIIHMALQLPAPNYYDVAALGVLYCTAAYGGRLVRWLGLASAVLGAAIATVYIVVLPFVQEYGSSYPNAGDAVRSIVAAFVGLLALLGLSWTLGLLVRVFRRARDSRRAQVLAEQDAAIEHERNAIARDMHDVVAHSLAVVIAQADGARYARANDPDAVDAALTAISSTAREALGDVRVLLTQLRHSQGESPQPALVDLDRLVDQLADSGLDIVRRVDGEPRTLPAGQQLALYRIVQEALTHALRHGDTSRPVHLDFAWTGEDVTVTVRNTRGAAEGASGGHGLDGLRERALLAGGTATAGPVGDDWVVTATLGVQA